MLEGRVMGDNANDMIEGRVCQFCGVFMNADEEAPGYPVTCDACEDDDDAEEE